MTRAEQKEYAQEFAQLLQGGASWQDWQDVAESKGLYSRDIGTIAGDVLFYVKQPYEEELANAVKENIELENTDLHPAVYQRIIDDERERFRRRTVTKMSADLSAGVVHADALRYTYDHPLLTEEDYKRALRRANGQREGGPPESKSAYLTRALIFAGIGIILMLSFGGFSGFISLGYGIYNFYKYSQVID
ncbi:hypothetical protein [Lewinella sp. 4G2]|uniref:hypothetical protein n=1 Tax=Lewinella sp. 4G2 TaxID=1803372 RepID=UPI0007B4C7D0|nr:hypothetical protein [Lewinella sp. 4G2]OAV44544.1 hypothetical protein A3850_008590 [Lewinella sp. 4G2]